MVTVTNPTGTTQTFVPSTVGIPASPGECSFPRASRWPADTSQNFNVVLTTPLNIQYRNLYFHGGRSIRPAAFRIRSLVRSAISQTATAGRQREHGVFHFHRQPISPSQVTVGQNDASQPYMILRHQYRKPYGLNSRGLSVQPSEWLYLWAIYAPSAYPTPAPNTTSSVVGTVDAEFGTTPGPYRDHDPAPVRDHYPRT